MVLPTRGQRDWDDELNNEISRLDLDVQTAKSDAVSARNTAISAAQSADAAALSASQAATSAQTAASAATAPTDETVAAKVNDPASQTSAALSATYASKDDLDGITVAPPPAMEAWFAALANRDNAPAKWYAIGDSITEGTQATAYTKRWVQRALDGIRTRFPTSGLTGGGRGHVPPYYDGVSMGTAYTSLSGTPGKETSFGIGRRCAVMDGTEAYTYTITGTSFDVWYTQGTTTGTIGVSVDGGAVQNIATSGEALIDGKTWNSGALSAGSHTVQITVVSGTVYFCGLTVYDGDESKGVRLYEGGHYGWKTTDWVSNSPQWQNTLTTVEPHLVTIALMTNDYQASVAPATCKTNIETLIAAVRSKTTIDPSVVLVVYPERGDVASPAYPWSDYVQVAHDIAATDAAVAVLDLTTRYTSPGVSNTLGLWGGDTIHPTDKGHALIADTFVGFVSPR